MARIFVSYRREDAAGFAGRIKDELERRFGDIEVFRDVDDIASGDDFVERLNRALHDCRVLVAVIGQNWLAAKNTEGTSRLHEPDDFVRREISAALTNDVLVIPVLVNGAAMPDEADLPDDLKLFARRQAHELADSRWDYDINRLGDRIENSLGVDGKPKPAGRRRWLAATAALVVVGLAGFAGWRYSAGPPDLAGTWDFAIGSYWIVEQTGADLTIQEVHYDTREVWKRGQGKIDGASLVFKLDMAFQKGYYSEGKLRLSDDGRRLTGAAVSQPRNTKADMVLTRR